MIRVKKIFITFSSGLHILLMREARETLVQKTYETSQEMVKCCKVFFSNIHLVSVKVTYCAVTADI